MEFTHEVQVLWRGSYTTVLLDIYKLDVEERVTPADNRFPYIIMDVSVPGFPNAVKEMIAEGSYHSQFFKLVEKAFKEDVQSLNSNYGD